MLRLHDLFHVEASSSELSKSEYYFKVQLGQIGSSQGQIGVERDHRGSHVTHLSANTAIQTIVSF